MKLGPWRYPVEGGACRVQDGGDIDVIEHRWAFIEKTPRVRIRTMYIYEDWNDGLNWCERNFKGDGPTDREAQDWCDRVLLAIGHTLQHE